MPHCCSDPERDRLKATTKPAYDQATGKLTEFTFDANKNGRIDTWTEMDGSRPLRSRIDSNEDGSIDWWEYYDDGGHADEGRLLAKGRRAARRLGLLDARRPRRPDRRLVGRRRRAHRSVGGLRGFRSAWSRRRSRPLVSVEEDTNHDGRRDKWEQYENGAVRTAEFDENHDGRPIGD